MNKAGKLRAIVALAAVLIGAPPGGPASVDSAEPPALVFRDVGPQSGLFPELDGYQGHAAGWGDVDGDGWFDLVVASFAGDGLKTNRLFRNVRGRFEVDDQPVLRAAVRATGALPVDLDDDGDLDLYVSSMPQPKKGLAGCRLYRNDGNGRFTDVSEGNAACPAEFGGRSAAALDFDGDGRLDLLVGEDPLPRYNGSPTKSARLFRNRGELRFEDASRAAGLPPDVPGLGVAAADVNNDGWPDFFLASAGGGNRLLLNDGTGKFRVVPTAADEFESKMPKGDRLHGICGVTFGDVNLDGLLDMVVGQHYDRPWLSPTPNRLYLQRELRDGLPQFEDVTDSAGLPPLPLKAPHVELQDFDNDGRLDLFCSMALFTAGPDSQPRPLVFRNVAKRGDAPRFETDALNVNDFPNDEDRKVQGTGPFFKKMVQERKVIYVAAAPTSDFDNDGRIDLFFCSWWTERPSLLLKNETPAGNWLQIQLQGARPVNRSGIGARIRVYSDGKLGDPAGLIGMQEVASGYGYASAQAAFCHFGLGDAKSVDVEVTWPHGKGSTQRRGVPANQRLTIAGEPGP